VFGAITESVVKQVAQNRRPPGQQEHEIIRAGNGAGMIVTALWWAALFLQMPEMHRTTAQLTGGSGLSVAALAVVLGWALFLIAGLFLLITGASRARGKRDVMVAAKASFWIAVSASLLWLRAFVPGWPLINFLLISMYVAAIASGATRLFLALRGMPAQRLPDPEEVGLPVSGPASAEDAARAMSGDGGW
jgi:hypothetical protein